MCTSDLTRWMTYTKFCLAIWMWFSVVDFNSHLLDDRNKLLQYFCWAFFKAIFLGGGGLIILHIGSHTSVSLTLICFKAALLMACLKDLMFFTYHFFTWLNLGLYTSSEDNSSYECWRTGLKRMDLALQTVCCNCMLQTRSKANCHVPWGGSVSDSMEQSTFSAAACLPADENPHLCGTRWFITVLIRAPHWTLSWTTWIQGTPYIIFIKISYGIILPRLGLPKILVPSVIKLKLCMHCSCPCACYMSKSSHVPWLGCEWYKLGGLLVQFCLLSS
jgi:hypothetical protein